MKKRLERQRRCLSCGEIGSGSAMLRFVVIKGKLVFDPHARVQQRGIWLSPRVECIMRACTKNMFKRAFRGRVNQKVIEAQPLIDEIKQALHMAFMRKLVMALRHGLVRLLEESQSVRSQEVVFSPDFALDTAALDTASLALLFKGKPWIASSGGASSLESKVSFAIQPTRLGRSILHDGMRLNSL